MASTILIFDPYECYNRECWDFWKDPNNPFELSHNEYTSDDEYGDRCAAPADSSYPVCYTGYTEGRES